MKKIIFSLLVLSMFILPMVSATYYYPEPIELNTGWNGVAIKLNNTYDITGDINSTLVSGWNLEGYSSNTPISFANTRYWYDGSYKTYTEALTSGVITEIPKLTNGTLSQVGDNFYQLKMHDAFWINVNQEVILNYPDVGGTDPTETFNWADIRFDKDGVELGIVEAGDEGWVESTLQYWDTNEGAGGGFDTICGDILSCDKITLSSYEGIFIDSNYDNILMLTGNETAPYTLTFKYKSNEWTIGNDNKFVISQEGNNFVVESDNKFSYKYLIRKLTKLLSGRWRN